MRSVAVITSVVPLLLWNTDAFHPSNLAKSLNGCHGVSRLSPIFLDKDDGVVELADDTVKEEAKEKVSAPFLSQGEIDQEALNLDVTDPKQARVIIYILISLLPVLFLIPLMLGSRDLIPLDALPPVEIN